MEDIKNLVAIANRVQETLAGIKRGRYAELLNQATHLTENLAEITEQSKRLKISLEHGWLSAAGECCKAVNRFADDISYYISKFKQLTDKPAAEAPRLSMLVEDLKQLQQEFGKVELDKEENTISVITEPITLEDIYLGPFEIKLDLNRLPDLYRTSPYYCIALDPHPAAASDDVTHPHVTGDRLCEGDGAGAIRAALEQGRLCDFFTLARSILNTYSPDSPYVRLDEWDGQACYECGYVTDEENSYFCSFCDQTFCEECSTCCRSCNETVCNSCSHLCAYCEESTCPNCVEECPECKRLYCSSCLEEKLCPKCKEELENENEQYSNQTTTTNEDGSPEQSKTTQPEIQHSS